MSRPDADQRLAAREDAARTRLLNAGAADLPRPPWRTEGQGCSAADLIRFALWCARDSGASPGGSGSGSGGSGSASASASASIIDEDGLVAALTLLPAARAEADRLEAAMLAAARSHGLSWPRISQAMGLASAQGAQQRFSRVSTRAGPGP
jgi:hypothetical protein